MNPRFSDWKWACLTALVLLGSAAFVIFVIHPGGFEGQIGWFIALFPGAIAGLKLSEHFYRTVPWLEPIALWTPTVNISFLWYFVISYMVIKACRFVSRALGNRE